MIKVMWFPERAEHLSLEEFSRWWLTEHTLDVAHHQSPHLQRYVVNVRTEDSGLPAAAPDGFDWDGVAEQWFDSVEAYEAAYSPSPSPTRAGTLAHTSRFARMSPLSTVQTLHARWPGSQLRVVLGEGRADSTPDMQAAVMETLARIVGGAA